MQYPTSFAFQHPVRSLLWRMTVQVQSQSSNRQACDFVALTLMDNNVVRFGVWQAPVNAQIERQLLASSEPAASSCTGYLGHLSTLCVPE